MQAATTDELKTVKNQAAVAPKCAFQKKKGAQNLVGMKETKVRTINER